MHSAVAIRFRLVNVVFGPDCDGIALVAGLHPLHFVEAFQNGATTPDVMHPAEVHARFATELVDDRRNTLQPLRHLDLSATHRRHAGPQAHRRSSERFSVRRTPRFQRVQRLKDLFGSDVSGADGVEIPVHPYLAQDLARAVHRGDARDGTCHVGQATARRALSVCRRASRYLDLPGQHHESITRCGAEQPHQRSRAAPRPARGHPPWTPIAGRPRHKIRVAVKKFPD